MKFEDYSIIAEMRKVLYLWTSRFSFNSKFKFLNRLGQQSN